MVKLTEVADSVSVKDGKGRTRPHSPCCFRLAVSKFSAAMVACHHGLTKLVSSSKCVGSWRRLTKHAEVHPERKSRKLVKSLLPKNVRVKVGKYLLLLAIYHITRRSKQAVGAERK